MKYKLLVLAAAAVLSTSCGVPFKVTIGSPKSWEGSANPLDVPGEEKPTYASLHAEHRSLISGDPVVRY